MYRGRVSKSYWNRIRCHVRGDKLKINNLKINGFGKLKDKNIEFSNGINLIYGKNQ